MSRSRNARLTLLVASLALSALAACGESDSGSPLQPAASPSPDVGTQGNGRMRHDFDHYVAMGTSVSMGWRSDGVLAEGQESSWPVQLAALAGQAMTVPRIAAPGCGSPLVAPLASGARSSGEAAGASFLSRSCAANESGVALPADNVAVNAALTSDALLSTPEQPDEAYAPLYGRVLPPGMSQVTAMMAQHPRLVSVELGANEVLGARDGAYAPGQTVVPLSIWAPLYRQLLDSVDRTAKDGVLVGLIDHALDFPSFRTGDELWQAKATFAPFNVAVSGNCEHSANVLFVPVVVPTAVGTGAFYASHGFGPYTMSCADTPPAADGTIVRDYILSPADVEGLDAQMAAMNAIIRSEAARRGYAYFALGALYDDVNTKAPFNAVTLMTSAEPYGAYISLDGVHPSTLGNAVLARAAAQALEEHYHMDLDGHRPSTLALAQP